MNNLVILSSILWLLLAASGCKRQGQGAGLIGSQSGRYLEARNIVPITVPDSVALKLSHQASHYVVPDEGGVPKPTPSLLPPNSLMVSKHKHQQKI